MRCNEAGLARFFKWNVNRPGSLIANVRWIKNDLNANVLGEAED